MMIINGKKDVIEDFDGGYYEIDKVNLPPASFGAEFLLELYNCDKNELGSSYYS